MAVAGYDLSSAFDTIDVNMVTSKLEHFGVGCIEGRWFHNYLSQRQQQVRFNGSRSTFRPINYGVQQGFILGPLPFLVLVADLPARVIDVHTTAAATTALRWGFLLMQTTPPLLGGWQIVGDGGTRWSTCRALSRPTRARIFSP